LLTLDSDEVGNSGLVTLKLTGAKFTENMQVILQHNELVLAAPTLTDELHTRFSIPEASLGDSLSFRIFAENKVDAIYLNAGSRANETNADQKIIGPFTADTVIKLPILFSGLVYVNTKIDTLSSNAIGYSMSTPVGIETVSLGYGYPDGFIVADRLYFVNTTKVFATFNLKGVETGLYHVHLDNGKEYTVSENRLSVVPALPEGLQYRVLSPSSVRANRSSSIKIEYVNTGNTDIQNPFLKVESVAGAPISETVEGLAERNRELRIGLQHPQEPANILRPGAYGTKTGKNERSPRFRTLESLHA